MARKCIPVKFRDSEHGEQREGGRGVIIAAGIVAGTARMVLLVGTGRGGRKAQSKNCWTPVWILALSSMC